MTESRMKMAPEKCYAVFDRMGDVLHDAFSLSHLLGVKTCVGTELPLTIPQPVQDRLRAAGLNPDKVSVEFVPTYSFDAEHTTAPQVSAAP